MTALAPSAAAQCVTGGAGGGFGPGTGGTWDATLPSSPLIAPLAVTVPGGATVLNSVVIHGLTHTWGGDVHIALQTPNGNMYNVLVNSDATSPGGGGCSTPFTGGDYTIVDIRTGPSGCNAGTNPVLGCGSFSTPGTYVQNFSSWTSGNAGLNNTPLESIPIASGTWNLLIYDWFPASDDGSISSFDLCFGSPSSYTPAGSSCIAGGATGTYPIAGTDGAWPGTLPTGQAISPLSVVVPAGSTKILAVKIHGMTHTWIGDAQIVLQAPSGAQYNLYQSNDGVFGGGCADDFNGEYKFIDPTVGTDECGNPGSTFPACGAGVIPSGAYPQQYGAWPSGSSGILNTDLQSIPVSSGTWNLIGYDWFVGADGGGWTSWELCFDAVSAPTAYCTAGTSTNGCVPSISASAQPSVSFANPCTITVANVEGQKFGIIFYGINNSGFTPTPWSPTSTSFLCVKGPTQRTGSTSSGGTINACDGALTLNWNAYQAANPTAVGNPWSAGDQVYVQGWYRDPPAPKTTNLSNALNMTYVP